MKRGWILPGGLVVALVLGGCTDAATDAPSSPAPGGMSVTRIIDGDTFEVSGAGVAEKVRVLGIDTPERQDCGYAQASDAAAALLTGATVQLTPDPTQDDRDRYGRVLRYVALPDGTDLGNRLIADGFAREYTFDRAYARQEEYRNAQADAAGAGRGLWSAQACGGVVGATSAAASPATPTPAGSSAATTAAAAGGPPSADCAIKGNISDNGRIYHLPGSRNYDRTGIDESRGERWFCSAEEAEAAGWRAAATG